MTLKSNKFYTNADELIKVSGRHKTSTTIPIISNNQNIPRLSLAVERYNDEYNHIYAYINAGHGFNTYWLASEEAINSNAEHRQLSDFNAVKL